MHIEVQVALNFVISYLYNKLPRRRVNIFGEELEKALKDKFQGHWYPDKPFKGSAFRCLKTGDPIDKVLERAARESGVPIQDILENLPQELAVWVDPGEVSYRIGEKGAVKVLFSDKTDPQDENSADREVTKTFNPEAQCFRPIESVSCSLNNLSLSPKSITPFSATTTNGVVVVAQQQSVGVVGGNIAAQQQMVATVVPVTQLQHQQISNNQQQQQQQQQQPSAATVVATAAATSVANNPIGHLTSPSAAPSPTSLGNSYKGSPSPVPAFIPRTTTPLTFTTATFAQTKFGSTKLKTSSKRANRMSPTEFSNYIKQRAMQQQLHQQPPHHSPGGGRALSPDPSAYYFPPHHPTAGAGGPGAGPYGGAPHQQQFTSNGGGGASAPHHHPHHHPHPHHHHRSMFESSNQFLSPDVYSSATSKLPFAAAEHSNPTTPLGPYYPNNNGTGTAPPSTPGTPQDSGKLLDNNWPYPAAGQYQHLLVAN